MCDSVSWSQSRFLLGVPGLWGQESACTPLGCKTLSVCDSVLKYDLCCPRLWVDRRPACAVRQQNIEAGRLQQRVQDAILGKSGG